MKLVFATGNAGKLREAAEILGDSCNLLTPKDAGVYGEAEETGSTFAENSYIKAKYIWDKVDFDATGIDGVIADDSGLEVDALGGAPGIYSARYAGEGHDFKANTAKLLASLETSGASLPSERKGRFRCVVTLILKDGSAKQFSGSVDGWIADCEAGCGGFGYDPVFVPTDEELAVLGRDAAGKWSGKTLAEIPEELKNAISHRHKALAAMVGAL